MANRYNPTRTKRQKKKEPRWIWPSSALVALAVMLFLAGGMGVENAFGISAIPTVPRLLVISVVSLGAMGLSVSILTSVAKAMEPLPRSSGRLGKPTRAALPGVEPEPPALADDEGRIRARLKGIADHAARMGEARKLVESEMSGDALAQVLEKLDFAAGVLKQQRSRHHAQLWVISLVRWQHRLARLTDDAAGSAPGQAPRRLRDLAAITGAGKSLLAAWEADGETAATREGARCVAHLRELLERCEHLRQGIVVREAMLTIRGIDPEGDVERTTALSVEPLESLQSDLGEGGSLTRALAELELEHERLRDDDEATRSVDRYLAQLEGGPA